MSSHDPREIWENSLDEGERRLRRSTPGLMATGLVGGADIILAIIGLVVVSGGLHLVLPEETAHIGGSLAFGIGFVLLIIGRSELFTENFLVPVVTVFSGRERARHLARLWAVTVVGNLAALIGLAALAVQAGVLPASALDAASSLAETFAERDFLAAFFSAILAGILMTILTWVSHAADNDNARVWIAFLIGFLLAVPSLNHAVVMSGEMALGLFADRGAAEWIDYVQNLGVAVLGNLVGGLGFVTCARLLQVQGEPG